MNRYLLVAAGVLCSSAAQILIKRASGHELLSGPWLAWMGVSSVAYGAAFFIYALILRQFPLSIAAPAMTVAVMCLVVLAGMLLGESLTPRQWIGIALGIGSLLAILG